MCTSVNSNSIHSNTEQDKGNQYFQDIWPKFKLYNPNQLIQSGLLWVILLPAYSKTRTIFLYQIFRSELFGKSILSVICVLNWQSFLWKVGCVHRENSRIPGYYDGRYWTLWKLPMFGCNDASQVLHEISECKKAYPNAYIRCLAFDNKKGQCMAFIIQRPASTWTTGHRLRYASIK